MKRALIFLICICLLLSLFACKDEGDDDSAVVLSKKYDYDNLSSYITIPDTKAKQITFELDALQKKIDNDIASKAKDLGSVKVGDSVDAIITVYEYVDDGGSGTLGELWYTCDDYVTINEKEVIRIESLGSGELNLGIEQMLLSCRVGGEIYTNSNYIIPSLEELEHLRQSYPEIYDALSPHSGKRAVFSCDIVSRPVREGDVVDVTYASYRTDENGEIIVDADGNYVRYDDEESSDTSTRIYVGSRAFLADFEKNLVNARVGEMVTFKITFPADYDNEELRTKTLAYEVKINSVYDAPKYDLSFIQANYGEHFTSVEEFEKSVIDSYAKGELTAYLVEGSVVLSYPSAEYKSTQFLLEQSSGAIYSQYGLTLEQYAKYNGYNTIDEYIRSIMKSEMAYYAYAQVHGLTVSSRDVELARIELIELYKNEYMTVSSATEQEALEYAEKYVSESATQADLYQEALYNVVGNHIILSYSLVTVPCTYTSVSKGGSLFS